MPCRATRASSFRACCFIRGYQSRRRQQRLHQAVSRPGQDELAKFDVVFLGDVGLEDGQLTTEHCRLLEGAGRASGERPGVHAGLARPRIFAAGYRAGRPLPCRARSRPSRAAGGRAVANHFELTELGRRSLLTKLADTQDDNAEVWEGLPGFQWYAPVLGAKAGSDVLCVHKDASNEFGRLPLLVTRTFGAGKVLFMGTDGAWRWRKGVEDKYHYRFWGQVVRWMAYQRNMAKGETMRLYYVARPAQAESDDRTARQRDGEQRRAACTAAR